MWYCLVPRKVICFCASPTVVHLCYGSWVIDLLCLLAWLNFLLQDIVLNLSLESLCHFATKRGRKFWFGFWSLISF
jgi:hypothetical protein